MCGIICEICYSNSDKKKVRTISKSNIGPATTLKEVYLSANFKIKYDFPLPVCQDRSILQRIENRGPDCIHTTELDVNEAIKLFFCGAVLWMQGPQLTPQPVENDSGILLYNGDIFDDSWDSSVSDTMIIMNKLTKIMGETVEKLIIRELKSLKGPFSIIYYDKQSRKLYFTRDRLGRNSLLFYKTEESIVISNVLGRKYNCVEIPATHIYALHMETNKVKLHSWADKEMEEYTIGELYDTFQKQLNMTDEEFKIDSGMTEDLRDEEGVIEYIKATANNIESHLEIIDTLLSNSIIKATVKRLTELLERSVKIRLKRQPNKCKHCLNSGAVTCSHSAVGVLFSGGLDCTILAFLAHKYISKEQSIDLLNVAFRKDNAGSYDVPDRITGRQSFEELKTLCPSRKWNFIEINVPKEELEEHQSKTIADLVFPRRTILDESLGSALWFAARGKDQNNTSPCRVLLVGSGADELFGGYKRHYNAFKRRSWQGLSEELLLDWKRISFRNLSRDNRVICDHGRQPRMPYLDEEFTNYVLHLKPWLKCFPSDTLGPGLGDKLMLRLVAFNLGLRDVVSLPKRALQFGSKIANKKEKGSDVSSRFLNT